MFFPPLDDVFSFPFFLSFSFAKFLFNERVCKINRAVMSLTIVPDFSSQLTKCNKFLQTMLKLVEKSLFMKDQANSFTIVHNHGGRTV